ncbi:MAG: hypothetical protein ACXWUH_08770, partial [Burkholderiales bacterium]
MARAPYGSRSSTGVPLETRTALYNCGFPQDPPWKPSASTSSQNAWTTSTPAPPSCGGIFDFDQKKIRLSEVVKLTEDPEIWNEPQRAQELGKERKALEGIVGTLERLDAGVRDARELYGIARDEDDDAT